MVCSVLLDEHLTCSPLISPVQMKLNQAIGILSKLRYQANIHVLKTVYIHEIKQLFKKYAKSFQCLPINRATIQ